VNRRLAILPAFAIALCVLGSLAAVKAASNAYNFYLASTGPVSGVKFTTSLTYVKGGKTVTQSFSQAFNTTNIRQLTADPGTVCSYSYPATVTSGATTYTLSTEADPSGSYTYSGGSTTRSFTLPAASGTVGIRGYYN
jgi:hypothetical protein